MLRCLRCGTLFVRQLPKAEDAFDYAGYYRPENLSVPGFIRQRTRETLGQFEGFRTLGRLFDVGFGAGTFLDEARGLGWETAGVEASAPPVEQAKANGHDARLLDDIESFPAGAFDVVVATEVVEHVEEPLLVVETAARLLRPGGLLYLTTPAGDGLNGRLLGARWTTMAPPEHLALFSARGLEQLLARGGFCVVESRTSGLNPLELLGAARTALGIGSRGDAASVPAREVSSVQLNELAMSNPLTARVKQVVNSALGVTGLGDTLKVFAEKV